MTVRLHERGMFTWSEWAQALGAEIAAQETSSRTITGRGFRRLKSWC